MSLINREKILNQTKQLANKISELEEVKIYQLAEGKIDKHKRVQDLITSIKLKQQELVKAKHFKKSNYIRQVEEELDLLNAELHSIPLVYQYQNYQKELNEYLQSVIQMMKSELSRSLPIEKE
ncbi:YlbF family regulator [Tepidibacillus marianensis]|uniref:YlbF family regulator n=1 Tax=Tepidibacillus marianensis TaxID=3131995 RepID=UPI0030CB673B